MEREGVLLAVAEARCRYRSSACFDDEVVVKTWIEAANSRLVRFGYEMRQAENSRVLATGETTHMFCGRDMKPMRLPRQYHARFGLREK
jgi:acyl-CoA thioester hydrolase